MPATAEISWGVFPTTKWLKAPRAFEQQEDVMLARSHVLASPAFWCALVALDSLCGCGSNGGATSGNGASSNGGTSGTSGSTSGAGVGGSSASGRGGTTDTGGHAGSSGTTSASGGMTGNGGSAGSGTMGGSDGNATGASAGSNGASGAEAGGSTGTTGGNAGRGGTPAGAGGAAGSSGKSGGAGTSGSAGAAACTPNDIPVSVTDLAFPEAQGFGRHATGGRNGKVVHVTNLNDSGTGSFRDAVSGSGRIVVFDVGGYIALVTAVSVKSDITIAGQSAPGGGIGFRGGEISFANSSNVVMRHVRIRPGSDTESDEDDALSLYRAQNVIVEHGSLEFAPWNNIDGVSDDWQAHPVTNITFQDSLIADPTGQQFGAHTESVSSNWSWYRNAFASSHNRNPLAKVNNVFVNNLLYNCSAGYTTHTSTSFQHDIVNNAFIFGPASTGTDNTWFQIDENQSIYAAGNIKDDNLNGTLDGAATTPYWYQGTGTVLDKPWSTEAEAPYSAASSYRIAVSQAGALPRDPMDALVVSQMRTLGKGTTGAGAGTAGPDSGLYTSQSQTGLPNTGYGDIPTGTKPTDTDGDGMPDFWEAATGSDPATDDAMKKAPDGYALVEHYLNWLAEPHAISDGGAAVDIDLAPLALGFAEVSPTFTVTQPHCGTATVTGGHTAHVTPAAGFTGVTSFDFTVKGSDNTTYTGHLAILVGP